MRSNTLAVALLTIPLWINGCSEAPDQRPNIILLMADDLGWGDTGFNGNEVIKTPHLDSLASLGVLFTRFYSAAPVCSPTRASVLTGRHPYRIGIYGANSGSLRNEEQTLAEILKDNGYRTGFFGKWHLGTLTNDVLDANRGGRGDTTIYSPPWENGFDVSFSTESKVPTWNPMVTPGNEAGDIGNRVPGTHFGTYYWTGPGERESDNLEGDDSRVILDRVIPFVEGCAADGVPCFTVLWFHTPHLPVLASESHRASYSDFSEDVQHYYGVITAMDEQIGRLTDRLKQLGLFENTLLFFTSDNGPEGRSRSGRTQGSTGGLRGRKRSLYEGGVRVPSLAVWPAAVKSGSVLDVPVSTSDYLPTVLNLPGILSDNQVLPIDGEDILPLILGHRTKRAGNIGFQSGSQRALTGERYKLYSSDAGETYELYDIVFDPTEQENIIEHFPEIASDMSRELEEWIVSCSRSDAGSDYR